MIISNIVKKEKLREIQNESLEIIADSLRNSFGPMGSNTEIYDPKRINQYTKDGYTILKNIKFYNVIEQSVQADLEDITHHIVKNVGDGTTSAVILSELMFKHLSTMESKKHLPPYTLIRKTNEALEEIKEEILKNKKSFDPNIAYDIAMISSNGNTKVSTDIKHIYEDFGNEVFIDVGINNGVDDLLKVYDGMTLNVGYSDTAYINNPTKGTATLRNPEIYMFEDPVDTPEMMSFIDVIIRNNLLKNPKANEPLVPTVILAPRISRDMGSYISSIVDFMYKVEDPNLKPPLLIVTNIYSTEQYTDISRMCGCKPIKKYLNPKQQEADIERGLAPTPETIHDFAGSADLVEADLSRTKFVNPKMMFNEEDGSKSIAFNTLVEFLEAELKKAYEENEDANTTGELKKRLNSLKSNLVEYHIGGVSASDRDNLKDLVEDTVLNCRSAADAGVGYAANFEALRASYKLKDKSEIHKLLFDAYFDLVCTLYESVYTPKEAKEKVREMLENDKPINIRTGELDERVLCSIKTDITILEALGKILSLMLTCNQFITPNVVDNIYK